MWLAIRVTVLLHCLLYFGCLPLHQHGIAKQNAAAFQYMFSITGLLFAIT